MKRQVFDYYKDGITEHDILFYGFHRHNGKISIDTKRLKKVIESEGFTVKDYFPFDDFITEPRNTHYFVPLKKKRLDYYSNVLVDELKRLFYDWREEYLPMIKMIKTPEEVESDAILSRIAFTANQDDYDEIYEKAFIEKTYRTLKYNELINSIVVQYIQKINNNYLRIINQVIRQNGYHNDEDMGGFNDVNYYVQKKFIKEYGKANPIFKLDHYRYFLLVSLLTNFTKHNSLRSYNDLYNNKYERDPEVKKFLNSFVNGDKEHKFTNGEYAPAWINVNLDTIEEIIDGLIQFSYEFCELCFNESSYYSLWNYDSYFIRGINKFIKEVIDCDIDIY